MALSFAEKRPLQKTVSTGLAKLKEKLSFTEKRSVQKSVQDALAQLKGDTAPPEVTPPVPEVNQDLADLQAGRFNGLEPMAFLGKLKAVFDQIGDVEPLKQPAIAYIEANQEKVGAVMESALAETFGKLWSVAGGA